MTTILEVGNRGIQITVLRSVDFWIKGSVKSRAFLLRRDASSPPPSGTSHGLFYPEIPRPQYNISLYHKNNFFHAYFKCPIQSASPIMRISLILAEQWTGGLARRKRSAVQLNYFVFFFLDALGERPNGMIGLSLNARKHYIIWLSDRTFLAP